MSMEALQKELPSKGACPPIPDISVIVPFFNERDTIAAFTVRLDEYCRQLSPLAVEIIFVDDGSSDDTVDCLRNVPLHYCTATIIRLSRNFGSHCALRAGILHAKAPFTTFLAADLQDPLEIIGRLYAQCKKGSNVAWAIRDKQHSGPLERFFSNLYGRLMRKYAVSSYPPQGIEVVMFDHTVRAELNRAIEANSSLFLHILSLGFKQEFIPCQKSARYAGRSKWNLSKKIKLFIDSFIAFSYAPIRMVSIAGSILALAGFSGMLYIIVRTLMFHDLLQGWPALVSLLMIGFGFNNIFLGILAEYVWRTLDASRKRPVFIIETIETLNDKKE